MKKLYIIGARGCGRETYGLYLECKNTLKDVKCAGFLDDKKDALEGFEGYPPIVGSVEDFIPGENDVFICALGDPRWLKHYTEIIEKKGGKFISLISPDASIGMNTKIGEGSIIARWTSISPDVELGKHCYLGTFSVIGHDAKIGNCCHMGSFSFFGGGVEIGNNVTVHPRVNIIPHKKIGNDAILGAGSIVIRNVKPGITVFGNPAKQI